MITADFVKAGYAIFTVTSKTGEYYTYKVEHSTGSENFAPAWFVQLLTGPDNTSDYSYLGLLDAKTGAVRLTKKSRYSDDSLPVKVIRWALGMVWSDKPLPEGYAIEHMGLCGHCGRALTTPESLAIGIGPKCRKMGM